MATIAIRVGARQVVVVIQVAGRASGRDVRSRQREACGAVIKIGRTPTESGMAVRTICQCKCRACSGVSGIIRLLPGCEVTSRSTTSCRGNL